MAIKHLKTLVMIAETGSFSSAAERLFITQSAVSMQMKALEEEWRVTLFDRKTRPPVLNARAWTLVPQAKAVVEQYEALQSAAASPSAELIGSIRVGVVPSAATALLPDVMFKLRRSHPGLTILAESGLSSELLFKVAQGQLDAAVVTEPDRMDAGVVSGLVRSEELKLFARDVLEGADVQMLLSNSPFIRFSSAMGIGRIVDDALRSRGIKVNVIVELDSIEAILRMVRLGLGIAIVPEHSPSRSARRKLSVRSLAPPLWRNVVMVTRREFAELPAVGVLHDTFKAVAEGG